MALEPDSFSRYRILGSLGSGGMGTVYLAEDTLLGRRVAIKCLNKGLENESARARFHREARALASLHHPNIVNIFDFGEHQDAPFIVMEYVEGETLRDMITERRPVPLADKLEIFEAICAGLAHAHQAGIIHRDVKPGNLMVGAPGVVKIVDFGLAKTPGNPLTHPGAFMGSPNYMAPEQVQGQEADPRTDVFAVAVALYETITYRQAFPGDLAEATHRILSSAPVPPSRFRAEVDSDLERVIMRGLSRNPGDRFPGMSQMQKELARARGRLQQTTQHDDGAASETSPSDVSGPPLEFVAPNETPWRRIAFAAGAVAVLTAGVLIGLWALTPPNPGSPPASAPGTIPTQQSAQKDERGRTDRDIRPRSVAGGPPKSAAAATSREQSANPGASLERETPEPPSDPAGTKPGGLPAVPAGSQPAAPPPAPPLTSQPQAQAVDLSVKEIGEVLRKYEEAHAAMDIATLKQLQPYLTVDDIRGVSRSFLDLTSYRLTIEQPQIVVSGAKARVDCTIARELVPLRGEARRVVNRTMIQLQRVEDSWVITSVTAVR